MSNLKTEIETLKGYLTHVVSLFNTCSSSSSERGKVLKKTFMSQGEIEWVFHPKLFAIIVEIRATLGIFVMLGTFKFPMEKWHGFLNVTQLRIPKDSHFKIIKCMLRYLKGTSNHGLWYPKGNVCCLVGYSYFDFVGCKSIGRVLVVFSIYFEVV